MRTHTHVRTHTHTHKHTHSYTRAHLQALTAADLEPALKDMKHKLMERNVAEQISQNICDSIARYMKLIFVYWDVGLGGLMGVSVSVSVSVSGLGVHQCLF